MNYLHKFHHPRGKLVLGNFLRPKSFMNELYRVLLNEFIQEEALAYELVAKHYL